MLSRRDKVEIRLKDWLFEAALPSRVYRFLWPGGDPFVPGFHGSKAIFVHVPKAAGSSVADALFGQPVGHRPIHRHIAYHPELVASYFKFTFVRNPWDRLHSAYHYFAARVGSDWHRDHRWANEFIAPFPSFQKFVEALEDPAFAARVKRYDHFRDQLDWLVAPRTERIMMDFIGRFESIVEDFAVIRNRLGLSVELPHRRKGGGVDYRAVYDTRMIETVRTLYGRDIQAFGYDFDGRACASQEFTSPVTGLINHS